MMYKIRNIVASRSKGCMSHNHVTLQAPSFSTHSIEPYINGFQLKLYAEMTLTDEQYSLFSNYLDELERARIVEVEFVGGKDSIEAFRKYAEEHKVKSTETPTKVVLVDIEEVPQIEEIPQIEEAVNIQLETPIIEEEEEVKVITDSSKKKKARK